MATARAFVAGSFGYGGPSAEDNRRFVNGVLRVVRSGMRWADLPERYGKYKSVHKRFLRWAEGGVWDRLFDDLVADRKNPPGCMQTYLFHKACHFSLPCASKKFVLYSTSGLHSRELKFVADTSHAPMALAMGQPLALCGQAMIETAHRLYLSLGKHSH